jgi:hypothetical protein
MRHALAGVPDEAFPVPPGVRTVPVDRRTGKRPNVDAGCDDYVVETFIEGTEPSDLCSRELHRKLLLPYPFQRYGLDVDGSLLVPRDELERLLDQEQDVLVDPESGVLLALRREGAVYVPVMEVPDAGSPDRELPDELLEQQPEWVGTDGRPARVLWFDERPQRSARAGRRP